MDRHATYGDGSGGAALKRELVVLLGGRRAGRVFASTGGRASLEYDEAYRTAPDAVALSLSLPLVAREHRGREVEAFLWGLLPDNHRILAAWGRKHQVSPSSVLGLLSHVGEDCPGAVQLVRPERLADIEGDGPVEWISTSDVGARLRLLREDHAAWRTDDDAGQFSLAGAQPKTALLLQDGRWGVPSGRTPTSHILKPSLKGLDGHAENEHACLSLARALQLPAAHSRVMWFDDEVAIVVERFDRRMAEHGRLARLHQEDMCQALGVHPQLKYENEGGPGAVAVVELLRDYAIAVDRDIDTFVGAVILSWLLAATDAHGKNYALLHHAQGRVDLAPLYDVASILPYASINLRKVKVAMKVGGKYRLHDIGLAQWQKLARELRLPEDGVIDRARAMARDVGPASESVLAQLRADGLSHEILHRLHHAIGARASACQAALR